MTFCLLRLEISSFKDSKSLGSNLPLWRNGRIEVPCFAFRLDRVDCVDPKHGGLPLFSFRVFRALNG